MITILPVKRNENECFVLSDGNKILAECVYSYKDSEIISVSSYDNDEMLMESVLRAALNHLDNLGKTIVATKITELGPFFSKLGFIEKNGMLYVDTTEFFKTCSCDRSQIIPAVFSIMYKIINTTG